MRLRFPPAIGRRTSILLLLLLFIPTVLSLRATTLQFLSPHPGSEMFFDLSIFLDQMREYTHTGEIYNLQQSGYFDPGSQVYKYPPPFAAILRALTRWLPSTLVSWLLRAGLLSLGLSLALLLNHYRPGWPRALLLTLIFVNWRPFWESLAGLQLELFMLLLLTGSFLALTRGRQFRAGIPIGLAGALKVYPGFLVVYFAARRQWRAVLGAAAGAAAAILAAAIALPARLTVEYFTRILPKLGGTSLVWENISLRACLGHLVIYLRSGRTRLDELASEVRPATVENCGVPGVRLLVTILATAVALLLLYATMRALRRQGATGDSRRVAERGFCASLCLLLFLLPSSWPDYHTLLVLPMISLAAVAPSPRRDPLQFALLAVSFLGGLVNTNLPLFDAHPAWVPLMRAWLPLTLWAAACCGNRASGPASEGRSVTG